MNFAAVAQRWMTFYCTVAGAAATLIGLMFVSVTFGAALVARQPLQQARAFVDPILTHFVAVFIISCTLCMIALHSTWELLIWIAQKIGQ